MGDLAEGKKNAGYLKCPKIGCRCRILTKDKAEFVERKDIGLALPASDDFDNIDHETQFWKLTNVMDFDNVSVTKTVGSIQYLGCADCDFGPLGFHDTQNEPKEYLISARRVREP